MYVQVFVAHCNGFSMKPNEPFWSLPFAQLKANHKKRECPNFSNMHVCACTFHICMLLSVVIWYIKYDCQNPTQSLLLSFFQVVIISIETTLCLLSFLLDSHGYFGSFLKAAVSNGNKFTFSFVIICQVNEWDTWGGAPILWFTRQQLYYEWFSSDLRNSPDWVKCIAKTQTFLNTRITQTFNQLFCIFVIFIYINSIYSIYIICTV